MDPKRLRVSIFPERLSDTIAGIRLEHPDYDTPAIFEEAFRQVALELKEAKMVLAALIKQYGGAVMISPRTLRDLPSNAVIIRADRTDGAMVFRLEEKR